LNFGSGFRHHLHQETGRGAFDTIKFGVMKMYIGGMKLNVQFMKTITLDHVSDFFGISVIDKKGEKKINEVLSVPQHSPLLPFLKMIVQTLNESGKILLENGYSDFSKLVRDVLSKTDPSERASKLVQTLVMLFPAFNDSTVYKNRTVKIYKKVQLLAHDLYQVMSKKDNLFHFGDLDKVTVMTDNVLPAVLRKFGILQLSRDLADHIDSAAPLPPGDKEVELRLCAVHACELIVKSAKQQNKEWTTGSLDHYLWYKGKDQENGFRQVERHYTEQTNFY